MKIVVLGTGCAKCAKLAENTEVAVQLAGVEAEIVRVGEVEEIANYGVLFTPALVIEGEVKVAGKVASPEKIAALIREAKAR